MSPHQHIGNPTGPPCSAHSIHPASSVYDFSSSSVYIQGVRRSTRFFDTCMTPKAGSPEGPTARIIRPIASPNKSLKQPVLGKKWRKTGIEMLSEDTLLEIFDFYQLDAIMRSWGRPWKWHRLAHVCRKWRHVISMSPRRLDLRIICEYGAPIGSILRSWPTLPLVVRFNSDESQKSKHLPRNVVVALRRPDRLCKIDFDVTSSITGSIIEAIRNLKPCQALESIRITVKDATGPSILVRNGFLGGSTPRLREIKLDGMTFPFPAIRQVLLSTKNLVELHLSKIPNEVYFSPEELVTGLSTLVQLKRLMVGFHSPDARPPPSMTRPPPQRTALPSLMSLEFHGATEYLEEFVARIDLHAFCKFSARLFNDIVFVIPRLREFIPRLNGPGSPNSVQVTFSMDSVGIIFFPGSSGANCYLKASCRRLDRQLSFVTQITSQLSPLLSSVHELTITPGSWHELPTGVEDLDSNEWLELFQPFSHVTELTVWDCAVQALVMEDAAGVLPELTTLRLFGYSTPSVVKAAEQFVATRRLSGRTVHVI